MKSFANDPSLDRVLLISREEMGGAAGGFDPLHPVYTQTEGADPFTYRNDFCHMRLLADGTVELTYTLNASTLAGTTIVVFETLYSDGVEIAAHTDINDIVKIS